MPRHSILEVTEDGRIVVNPQTVVVEIASAVVKGLPEVTAALNEFSKVMRDLHESMSPEEREEFQKLMRDPKNS